MYRYWKHNVYWIIRNYKYSMFFRLLWSDGNSRTYNNLNQGIVSSCGRRCLDTQINPYTWDIWCYSIVELQDLVLVHVVYWFHWLTESVYNSSVHMCTVFSTSIEGSFNACKYVIMVCHLTSLTLGIMENYFQNQTGIKRLLFCKIQVFMIPCTKAVIQCT